MKTTPVLGWAVCRLAGLGLLASLLAGCAMKRSGYDVPEVVLPAQYKNAPVPPPADVAPSPDAKIAGAETDRNQAPEAWWRFFGNRELEGLIDRGIANNPDVRMATFRLAQAKARADQAKAGQLPEVTAPVVAANQYPAGTAIGDVPVEGERNKSQKSYQASLRGTWRLDVWGEQSALAESAQLQLWRAVFEREDIQRNLAASLASNYVEYAALNDRLRVARELETVLSSTLATVERRMEAGDATLTELEQQRAAIYSLRATIPALEQQREDAINAIAFLVGTVPKSLELSNNGLDSLSLPSAVPGIPSALLLRRPDIRMAEARMLSADADIDVARARLLPPMDLSAQVGYSSVFLGQLFQPHALFWNTIASVTASIFDAGKRTSEKEFTQAVHEEMVEAYIRAINQAMREVETSLATVRLAAKRLEAQEEAANAARRAWEISSKVYLVGGADYLTLLETERTYYRYLDEYQRTRMEHYRGYISLFQALGGGVKQGEATPGGGTRPAAADGARVTAGKTAGSPQKANTYEGVDLMIATSLDEGMLQTENFWQVELAGIYHRTAIGSAWRDLRARYPRVMDGRSLRPRLSGRIEESADDAWYRLYVAKFASVEQAHEFCFLLLSNQQRCRVVSSNSDETVPAPATMKTGATATVQPIASAEMQRAAVVEASPKPVAVSEEAPAIAVAKPLVEASPAPETIALAPAKTEPAKQNAVAPEPAEKLAYTVQLGAYSNLENAAISHALWRLKQVETYVSENRDAANKAWYTVRTGIFEQKSDGANLANAIRQKEGSNAVVVPTVVDRQGRPAAIPATDLPPVSAKPPAPVVPEPPEAAVPVATVKPATKAEVVDRGAYTLQLGAYSTVENAAVSHAFWRGKGYDAYVAEITDFKGRPWFAVRNQVFFRQKEAADAALSFGRKENAQALVVPTLVDRKGAPRMLDAGRLPKPVAQAAIEPAPIKAESKPALPVVAEDKPPLYAVQIGAFSSLEKAARTWREWQDKGYKAQINEISDAAGRILYAVRTGLSRSRREAADLVRSLGRDNQAKAMLVVLDGNARNIDVSQILKGGN